MFQLFGLKCRYQNVYCTFSFFSNLFSTNSLVPLDISLKALVVKDRKRKKKIFKDHFIENLFINIFQEDVLEYPEIPTLNDFELLTENSEMIEKFLSHTINTKKINLDNSDNLISTLKNLEMFGFKLPKSKNGFGYLESEFNYIQESISLYPSVSKSVAQNENFGIELINLFGNESQKEKYLPKLASGENTVCFACFEREPLVSLQLPEMNTCAIMSSDGKNYIVSGKKHWVYNPIYSDLIIFSAKVISEGEEKKTESTLFLIEKNLDGVKVHEPVENIGLKGVDICELTFDNVKIPSSCVLGNIHEGNKLLEQIFSFGKLHNGAECCGIMRKFINEAIHHCNNNKIFKENKSETSYFKIKIGNLVAKLYGVESMTYLVSGRLDGYYEPNVFLESLILKIFASESLQYVLQQCVQILGTNIFSDDLKKIIRDSLFYTIFEDSNDYFKLLLSTVGCQYAKEYQLNMGKLKKLKKNLSEIQVKEFFGLNTTESILKGYLHPLLESEAILLEYTVLQLKKTVDYLFKKHGDNIFNRHLELTLLSDLLIHIYALTAILSRASRSYCIGVKYQETDYRIATAEAHRIYAEFNKKIEFIKNEALIENLEKISSSVLKKGSYTELVPNITKLKLK